MTCLGDLTGDGKVDSFSFFAFLSDYIAYWTTGHADPAADFNHNGIIDASAFFAFTSAYISYWTGPTPFINNGLTLTMSVPKETYNKGETVDLTLSIKNVSDKTVTFVYTSSIFDFIVYNATGIVYRNSYNIAIRLLPNHILCLPDRACPENFGWTKHATLTPPTLPPHQQFFQHSQEPTILSAKHLE